ncbi:urease accessory protein UreE [Sphingobacterium faecium]|uniref:urease accessory protein UreE n=1 Tax=Sphingobacterium faecium TaxID=34087 RepID=UPI00320922DE
MLVIERNLITPSEIDLSVIDLLAIDWYEVNKTVLSRETRDGRSIRLHRTGGGAFADGEVVYASQELAIQIHIKPCACIVLKSTDLNAIGHFCFDVGNRHLPLFWFDDELALAYDGQLYPALKGKYGNDVVIEMRTLSPAFTLQPFGV